MHLNYPVILKVTGLLTLIEGISMLPCVLTAMIYEEWNAARALFPVSMFCICIGFVKICIGHLGEFLSFDYFLDLFFRVRLYATY